MSYISETSIIVVTFNHQNYIMPCLNTLQNENPFQIIVVDNNSSDKTVKLIEDNFPLIKLIKSEKNIGFGAGVNLGVRYATGKYLVILNPDTKVKENAIEKLIEPLKRNSQLITIPKVLIYDGSKINTCGITAHFTGLSFTRGLGQNPDRFGKSKYINGLSGVCFAISRDNFNKMGGFNEKLFLYMEDAEFSWKAKIAGLKILYVSEVVIYHDYTLKVKPEKLYHLEKGRYLIIRKYLTWKEYLILSPSFLMTEILTWGYSLLKGPQGIKYKLKAIKDGLNIKVNKYDSNRKKLIKSLDWCIPQGQLSYGYTDKIMKKIANFVYYVNYRLIR